MRGNKQQTLEQRWTLLEIKKNQLMSRCETYARYTIPSLFPSASSSTTQNAELLGTNDSIGARCVNHLSNKVVTTLFRPQGPFFRLRVGAQQKQMIAAALQTDDKAAVAEALQLVEQELSQVEQMAVERQDMVAYRPAATMAAKLLVTTGNAMMYHPEKGSVQVFSLRDYCVVRDIAGEVIEIMTREEKAFETFHPDVQIQLRAFKRRGQKEYEDADNIKVYTRIKLEDDGKYHVTQEACCVELDIGSVFYPKDKLRWVPLTWSLARGEDYGRGLVEEYASTFHALEVYNQSLINIAGIMGDIKFLVNPASVVDVVRLNNSPAGSYHSGREGDVTAIETKKQNDAQFILLMIERLEKQLSQAFLLNSSMIRDAERVTTEEIRLVANELETSNGGVYSRLALQWQVPTANILLDDVDFDAQSIGVMPQIITGMDSLSRQGELDNIRMFISDMAMLDAVPEEFRAAIDPLKFAAVIGTARQVDYSKFLYTQEQMAMRAEQQQKMMVAQEQAKAQGAVAAEAGKAAVQES